jgi:hypothetical protein
MSNPVYLYVSNCCNTPAKKPALVRPKADEQQEHGLGKWTCVTCHKPCKVKVQIPVDNAA